MRGHLPAVVAAVLLLPSVVGAPLGMSFFGTAFSEPKLIKLASGFEAVTHVRANNVPTFAPTVPFNNIQAPPSRGRLGGRCRPAMQRA